MSTVDVALCMEIERVSGNGDSGSDHINGSNTDRWSGTVWNVGGR